jgi:hypothetical protein
LAEDIEAFYEEDDDVDDVRLYVTAIASLTEGLIDFATKRVKNSMPNTDFYEDQLIRMVIGHCEKDMADIRHHFEELYEDSLREAIRVIIGILLDFL